MADGDGAQVEPESAIVAHAMPRRLSARQRFVKRSFDIVVSGIGLVITAPVTATGFVAATLDTRQWGIFSQQRVGRGGQPIRVHKLRTMRHSTTCTTTVTTANDPRITPLGRQLRRFKLDELPQLYDVFIGAMSIIGPRPDTAGWADVLQDDDRVVLSVRPGITGPASLVYRHEEEILAGVDDPERYNAEVIWPDKVRINRAYVQSWSLSSDLQCLRETVASVLPCRVRNG